MAGGVLPAVSFVSFAKQGQWGWSRGLPGEHKGPCAAPACPPSFPRGCKFSGALPCQGRLGLAAAAGGGPVDPSPELCLEAGLPGTHASRGQWGLQWEELWAHRLARDEAPSPTHLAAR